MPHELDGNAITLDLDWAPDWAIQRVADRLREANVAATWFITHDSPAVRALRRHGSLFELGIHPNFHPGSTHGADPNEVMDHCLAIVPEARTMRTHGLVQSSRLLDLAFDRGIDIDTSLFLPGHPHLRPVPYPHSGGVKLRVPYFFEDDVAALDPDEDWDADRLLAGRGMRVFDFHPIHVALNTNQAGPYRELVKHEPRLQDAEPDLVERLRADGPGTHTLFDALVERLAVTGSTTITGLVHGASTERIPLRSLP